MSVATAEHVRKEEGEETILEERRGDDRDNEEIELAVRGRAHVYESMKQQDGKVKEMLKRFALEDWRSKLKEAKKVSSVLSDYDEVFPVGRRAGNEWSTQQQWKTQKSQTLASQIWNEHFWKNASWAVVVRGW